MPKALVVIPTYLREQGDLDTTIEAVESIGKTETNVETLLVDDGSPESGLVKQLCSRADQLGAEVIVKQANEGFSKTVNVGLQRALDEGRDAVLMNADVECQTKDWLNVWRKTTDDQLRPADVAGALLMFPDGLIQHAGIYFSLLTRTFDHMYKFGPMNLPEAHRKRVCPVTGAFQFIRHETLTDVGLYDESFSMGWEDVDYCLRVMLAGRTCVYQPGVRAYHHEMKFRGRPSPKVAEWQQKSWFRLATKYREQSFAGLVPYW